MDPSDFVYFGQVGFKGLFTPPEKVFGALGKSSHGHLYCQRSSSHNEPIIIINGVKWGRSSPYRNGHKNKNGFPWGEISPRNKSELYNRYQCMVYLPTFGLIFMAKLEDIDIHLPVDGMGKPSEIIGDF